MNGTTYENRRDEAIAWLNGRINYESRTPIPYNEQGMKLDRMRELARRLGDPQDRFPVIHLAGTKGKGSTGAMIAAGLQAAGLRVGVYSSPHFDQIEERFAVNGEPCSGEELAALTDRVRAVAEQMDAQDDGASGPTFFDLTTAIALVHFADQGVDAAVIEVGLGGRLDSTNIVTPEVAVITSISLDHTKQLGDTVEQIAAEKAGIIKPGRPVVSGVANGQAGDVIELAALKQGSDLWRRGDRFGIERNGEALRFSRRDAEGRPRSLEQVRVGMLGDHQAENAATALAVLGLLADSGWMISADAMRAGVASAWLPGRIERFPGEPMVVIDGAHNDRSAAALAATLDEACCGPWGETPPSERVLLVAIATDKDAPAVLRPLVSQFGHVVATRFVDNPRALSPETLATRVAEAGGSAEKLCAADPAAAYHLARQLASDRGAIVFAGSLLFAAEARRILISERGVPPR